MNGDYRWNEISTDRWGFATEEAIDEMVSNVPILIKVLDERPLYFALNFAEDFVDWSADLTGKPSKHRWCKIHE